MAKIGIQLFTVQDMLEKDYVGTIKKMKDFGYDGVEFPVGTMKMVAASDLKSLLAELNLQLIGIFFEHTEFQNDLNVLITYCKECNCNTVLYPCIPEQLRQSEEDYIKVANQMNEFGMKLKQNGLDFLYHIHGYEFETFGGKTAFDILLENINTDYVKLEIDVYWVEFGGVDSVKFVEKYAHLSPNIHFKDCVDTKSMEDTETGTGCIDMTKIAQIGIENNANWFIVEQEQFRNSSMESAEISAVNLINIYNKAKG